MTVRYFILPFCATGDKATVPNDTQTDGTVSYTDGYGPDYSLPRSSDPAALNVERTKMNELFYDVTLALQQYQQFGAPDFISTSDNGGSPFSYSLGALVRYTGQLYMSTTNSNTSLPSNTLYWILVSDIIAAATTQANIATASSGYQWTYSTTTTASDPGSGFLRFNNTTLASATALYISETTGLAQIISADIATWDDSTSTIHGTIRMVKRSNPAVFALYNITGTITDNGTWDTITVAYVAGSGSFANSDLVSTQFVRNGDKGDTGTPGTIPFAAAGGTGNAITANFTPDITLSDGQICIVRSGAANTSSVTFTPDGLTTHAITKNGGTALSGGEIPAANFDMLLVYDLSNTRWELLNPANTTVDSFGSQLLFVRDEKSSGSNGGTFTSGSWQTRALNTVVTNQISGASLASNAVTLTAGSYIAMANAPFYRVDVNKVRLQNTTDATTIIEGQNAYGMSSVNLMGVANLFVRFTISGTKTIELQHQCGATGSANGFGSATSIGAIEVYAELMVWKVAP